VGGVLVLAGGEGMLFGALSTALATGRLGIEFGLVLAGGVHAVCAEEFMVIVTVEDELVIVFKTSNAHIAILARAHELEELFNFIDFLRDSLEVVNFFLHFMEITLILFTKYGTFVWILEGITISVIN
jgi:hypothetical protein